ncbi:MAG: GDSL family lipase, partial [Lachnospiraceae bacterium]|nr:GDSL family lipase [Lachnospiraceae bacterium]
MKKKLLLLFCAAVMAFSMTACGSDSSDSASSSSASESVESTESVESVESTESTEKKEDQQLVVTSENAKLIGRTYSKDNILWFSLSGSGAEFKFNGKKCEVTVRGDSMVTQPVHSPRFAIYVDGIRLMDKTMEKGIETVEVLNTESEEEHVIRVIKLSESSDSTMGLVEITCDSGATVTPTSEKSLKMEFVGDSITCGYGVDGVYNVDQYSTSIEDCTKAYAIKTAEKLDADYSLVSYSGYGIISGWSAAGEIHDDQRVPDYYTKFGKSLGTFALGTKPIDIEWDFSYKPDIVVINLGTNDSTYTKNDSEKIEDYTVHYIEFLKLVREKNNNAKIVCVLGIMGQDLCPAVEDTVNRYKTETGDNEVYYLKLDQQGSEVVVDWHPTEAS